MKLMILTGKFGMGHWAASLSLKQQLERSLNAKADVVDFFAAALPELSPALYKSFQLLVTYGGGLYNLIHILTESAKTAMPDPLADALTQRFYDLALEEQPDAVIATHPLCAQLVSRFKQDYAVPLTLVTCITDVTCHSEWLNSGTDCYFVGSPTVREGLIAKGVAPEIIEVTGIPVREEFKQPVRRGGGLPRNLLIMGGGLGMLPKRDSFYDALNVLPHVHTTIITGHNEKLRQRLAGRWENIEVLGFTDRVCDYMARSDLMLSKPGGSTMFEAIFSRLPLLAWAPQLAQEKENARFLTSAGVGLVTRRSPEACLDSIRQVIYDDSLLAEMSENAGRLRAQLRDACMGDILSALTGKGRAAA